MDHIALTKKTLDQQDDLREPDVAKVAMLSECLVRHFQRIQFVVASRMGHELSRRFSAEDLAHEVIVEALENHRYFEYRGEGPFVRWVSTIAHRVVCDAARRQLKKPRALSIANDSDVSGTVRPSRIPGAASTPSSIMAHNEKRTLILKALATMRESDRAIIRMVHLEGLSVKEAAAYLGCSAEAAAKRLSRALDRVGSEIGRS